ncbi:MAG: hypothetical protein EXS49_00410 [Candidatus Pacebacteria bacterium]|nr:hypothetical protein [Candidatus Paceibacterota bacterium]
MFKKIVPIGILLVVLSMGYFADKNLASAVSSTSSINQENTIILCSDGIDNDSNGKIDLDDKNCADFTPLILIGTRVVNNNGGTATQKDFNLSISHGNGNFLTSFQGGTSTLLTLRSGNFSATSSFSGKYTATYGSGCSGNLILDSYGECLIVFNDILNAKRDQFFGSKNTSFGNPSYSPSNQSVKIGSFNLSVSSLENIEVSNITIKTSSEVNTSIGNNLKIQNLKIKINGNTWGKTVPTVSKNTAYSFSNSGVPYIISAGTTITFDVYVEILNGSTITQFNSPISFIGSSAVGQVSRLKEILEDLNLVDISKNNPVLGQDVTVVSVGALNAAIDASIPTEQQLILGSTGVTLAQFKFSANNVEDIRVDSIRITASTSVGAPSTFSNLQFYDGTVAVGPKGTALVASSTRFFTSDFSFANSLIVPKNTTKTYTLKGDVTLYASSTNSHNKFYNFQINSADNSPNLIGDIKAYGVTYNIQLPVSATPTTLQANTQNALRTKLTPSMSTLGATSNRVRTSVDDIGTLTLSAAGAPADTGAEFKSVNFLFSGAAIPNSTTIYVALVDSNGSVATSTNIKTSIATSSGVVLTLSNPWLISKGFSTVFKVRVDSSNFANNPSSSDGLSWQLASTSAIVWATQGSSSVESLGLEKRIIPITNTVSYQ